MFRIQNALNRPVWYLMSLTHSWFRGKPITGSVPYVEMNSKGAEESESDGCPVVVVLIVVVLFFWPVFFSLLTRNDFPSPTGEPICLLCKVQGHSLNFETSCRNEKPFPFPTASCESRRTRTLCKCWTYWKCQYLVFNPKPFWAQRSLATCFVTVAVGAVVPLYLGLSALERDLGVQSSLLAWRKRLETTDTLPIVLVVQWTITSKTSFIYSGLQ